MRNQPSSYSADSLTAPSCHDGYFFPCSSSATWNNYRHFSRFWDQSYGLLRLGFGTQHRWRGAGAKATTARHPHTSPLHWLPRIIPSPLPQQLVCPWLHAGGCERVLKVSENPHSATPGREGEGTDRMRNRTWSWRRLHWIIPSAGQGRPTQWIVSVPVLVNRFHRSILLVIQYKYLKFISEDFILQILILRTRSCGTAFITQHSWLLHFREAEICLVEMICTTAVPASKGHLGGASP